MLNPFGFLLHPLLFLGFCGERGFSIEWVQHRMGADGHRTKAVEQAKLFPNRCSRPLSAPLLHCGGAILVPKCSAILVPREGRDPCAKVLPRSLCHKVLGNVALSLVPVPSPLGHRIPYVRAQASAQERRPWTPPYVYMDAYAQSNWNSRQTGEEETSHTTKQT